MDYIADGDFANKTSQGIVLVDFYATWCMPCLRMEKQVESFASNNSDVSVYKYDVDRGVQVWNDIKKEHNVRSIPFIVIYKNGKAATSAIGYKTADQLQEILDNIQ